MSASVEFLPEVPDLRARASVIAWLSVRAPEQEAHETGPPPDVESLRASGALTGAGLHPRLEAARTAIRNVAVHVTLERGDRRGHAWVSPFGTTLAHPLPDGRARMTMVPPTLLIDAIIRLNDVGPRPRPRPRCAVGLTLAPGSLSRALIQRDPGAERPMDGEHARALAGICARLREHWKVTARWVSSDGEPDGRALEILDTEEGYWQIVPRDEAVDLWPTTSTRVLRELCLLFPPAGALRGWAVAS